MAPHDTSEESRELSPNPSQRLRNPLNCPGRPAKPNPRAKVGVSLSPKSGEKARYENTAKIVAMAPDGPQARRLPQSWTATDWQQHSRSRLSCRRRPQRTWAQPCFRTQPTRVVFYRIKDGKKHRPPLQTGPNRRPLNAMQKKHRKWSCLDQNCPLEHEIAPFARSRSQRTSFHAGQKRISTAGACLI